MNKTPLNRDEGTLGHKPQINGIKEFYLDATSSGEAHVLP